MSDVEVPHEEVDDLWLVNTVGGLFLAITAFVFLVSWDFLLGAGVFAGAVLIAGLFVPQVRRVVKPPHSRVTGSFTALVSIVCSVAGWLMGPAIAANTTVFAVGSVMAVGGLTVGLLGTAIWRDRFGLLIAFVNTSALVLAVWLFVTDRIPVGTGT